MKKTLLVVIPLLLLLGGAGALAILGVIHIPGITPSQKGKTKPKQAALAQTSPIVKKKDIPSLPPSSDTAPPAPLTLVKKPSDKTMDRDQGAKKLAELWNGVETNKLIGLLKDWKDPEIARVFAQMDADKVAEILGQLEPKRASKISLDLEKEASIVKDET